MLRQLSKNFCKSSELGFDPPQKFPYSNSVIPIPHNPQKLRTFFSDTLSKFSQNPGDKFSENLQPRKIDILKYSKNFLPKLIFLRKGVHHPNSGFLGFGSVGRPIFARCREFFSTSRTQVRLVPLARYTFFGTVALIFGNTNVLVVHRIFLANPAKDCCRKRLMRNQY